MYKKKVCLGATRQTSNICVVNIKKSTAFHFIAFFLLKNFCYYLIILIWMCGFGGGLLDVDKKDGAGYV